MFGNFFFFAPLLVLCFMQNRDTEETQLSQDHGRRVAEELVLMPAFRDKFRSPVQRPVLVRLHDFQFFHNPQVASLCGILVGGRFLSPVHLMSNAMF